MAPVPRPSWAFDRSPQGVRITLATGRAHGIPSVTLLRDTGLTREALDSFDTRVEAGQELAVARNLLAALGDEPGLGVETGLRYPLGTVGILGFALLSSPTTREAIGTGLRYIGLNAAFVGLALTEHADKAHLRIDDSDIPDDVREFIVERDIGVLIGTGTKLFGRTLPDAEFRAALRLSAPRRAVLADLLGGIDSTYSEEDNSLTFPRALLDAPLPAADPVTARSCARYCAQLLDQRRARTGTAAAVRARLLAKPGNLPSMEQIAREFNVTTRTLHRRLFADGVSFRLLVDEVRETLATALLIGTELSVEQIARRLGYAEIASFTHAFTRWHGIPPGVYRRTHRSA